MLVRLLQAANPTFVRPARTWTTPMHGMWIGTSGWHYPSWTGPFFPRDLRRKDHLAYYAERFSTTELNGVFYRTPSLPAVRAWREGVPEDFVFAWKASKFITHWKRLGPSSPNLSLLHI